MSGLTMFHVVVPACLLLLGMWGMLPGLEPQARRSLTQRTPTVARLASASAPLAVSCLMRWLVMEGRLSLGGGEKDVLLVLPLVAWSLAFAIASLAMWARRIPLGIATRRSALAATAALVAVLAALAIRGRP